MAEHLQELDSSAFQIRGLEKRYPGFRLGPLDLNLERGRVLGFVGPNGSGKSTTLKCMVGTVKPEAGTVSVLGSPAVDRQPEWRQDIGVVGEQVGFFQRWTVARNLKFVSRFSPRYSQDRARELMERLELQPEKRVGDLSRGGLAKMALVVALVHSPRLLLLDEPTASLDPVVRAEVLDLLFDLQADGEHSIFFSTHVLSDLGRLADELVFLHDGKVFLHADKVELEESWRRVTYRKTDPMKPKGCVSSEGSGSDWRVISSNGHETLEHLREMGAERIESTRLSIDQISVEILRCAKKGIQP